jgi:predicted cobalt transporter CbtA
MSRHFGLTAHEMEDEAWRNADSHGAVWAYCVFGVAVSVVIAVGLLLG